MKYRTAQGSPTHFAKPISARVQPWSSFPELSYYFMEEDYLKDSKAVFKVHAAGPRGGIEQEIRMGENKKGTHLSDQTKFWLALPKGRALYARLRQASALKVHYDNGISYHSEYPLTFYSSLSFTRSLQNLSCRFGVSHVSEKLTTDLRLKFNTKNENKDTLLYNRTLYRKDDFIFGFLGSARINSMVLEENKFLIGYQARKNLDVFFRAEHLGTRMTNPGSLSQFCSQFALDVVSNYDQSTKIGAELAYSSHRPGLKHFQFVLQTKIKQTYLTKLKLRSNKQFFQFRALTNLPSFEKGQYGSLALGVHWLKQMGKNSDWGQLRWGVQLQVNL